MINLRDQLQKVLGAAYTLENELGGGGMSRVFIATDSFLGRRVVVKVLPPDLAATVKVERFRREVKFLARLQHAHIVPLLAAGGTDGLSYYVMPFMEGESLRSRIARRDEIPMAECVRILREVASALAFAHERGIVHRDIKPDNVLICGGAAMVTDFGVAKAVASSTGENEVDSLTSLGVALGTPAYIAPEQATADPSTDHRADIYSFGVMAYELLTGSPPFVARSPQALLAAHVTEKAPAITTRDPDIPETLAFMVMRCLEKQPADRPQRAGEIMSLLDEVVLPRTPTPAAPFPVAGSSGRSASATGSGPAEPPANPVRVPLAATVVTAAAVLPDATVAQSPPGASTSVPGARPSRGWLPYAGGAVLLAGLAGVALMKSCGSDDKALAAAPGVSAKAPDARDPKSIAVLPLVNASGDSANEYFSDGMTDELASALGRVAGLRVASPTSAFTFKGVKADAREIGRKLNVATLLEGTVRREGDKLRVSVQLTNAEDNLSIWAQTYERRMKDVFAVQDSISRAVVEALQLELTGTEQARLTQRGTNKVEAFDLYQRGRFLVNRNNEPDIRRGLGFYQRALATDSEYARAWAGVAYAWIALADDFVAPRDAYPTAKLAAVKAISLDPTLAEARAALGAVRLWFDWDFPGAEKELTEAIRLEPNGVYAYRYYGNLLKATGRFDSALAVIRKAQQQEPLSAGRIVSIALMYTTLRKHDLAIRESQRALTVDPQYADAFLSMGNALLAQGRPREAIASFRRAPQMGNRMKSAIAIGEAALGNGDTARRLLAELEAESRRRYVGPEAIAAVYFSLGDRDAGFEWLERAYDARSAYMTLLRSDRRWDPVRDDPRFSVLMRKVGV